MKPSVNQLLSAALGNYHAMVVSIMNTLKRLGIFLSTVGLLLAVVGCAAHPDPIVDMQGVNPDLLAKDWEDCEGYSEEIAIGQGVAKGAGVGAGVGAVGGAVNDHVGRSAANGALIGATRSGLDADREKQKVFKRCLRGRGYRVLN
jgi:outer membrane lipoprotein SlyB